MDVFYESRNIPVHSCIMLEDRDAAIDFPKRDLTLGFCPRCGFVSNVGFDPSVQHYTGGYEEQQSFSPRFRAFQIELIERLIERYDIRRRNVIEIGCGKGDFLVELCERGDNRGVGIDPACDPERMKERGNGRVRFVAEEYGPQHASLPCDVLCCRHTLEHIHPTHEFVRSIRAVIGARPEVLVFFEVPAVERVLAEGAFWDIYYEHCSYFSLGSLARVFRSNGFDVVELGSDFDEQYLLIVATPAEGPTEAAYPHEDDLAVLGDLVRRFRNEVPAVVDRWRRRVTALKEAGKRIAVWGSGSKCVSFLSTIGMADAIDAIVDINPYRHGKYLAGPGKQVEAPQTLAASPPDAVIVMNPVYCGEIQNDLDVMGVRAELMPV